LANGVPSVHWNGGFVALRVMANICRNLPPTQGYGGTLAFFDMEWVTDKLVVEAFKAFPLLYAAHPDAVFILNTRARDAWIKSRLAHAGGDYARAYQVAIGAPTIEALVRYWADEWERHHFRVREFFTGRGRLVEFNIETDGAEKLAAAMPEFNLDPSRYERIQNRAGRYVDSLTYAAEQRAKSGLGLGAPPMGAPLPFGRTQRRRQ
ncbi:MAG TPA: hypothetical protein VMI72_05720, partial [Roseiarcus sp.]|nr:hypothetical protein [Roseiarcus sp.]